jgi:Fur family ferric uptake transcriptional regulator
MDQLVKDIYDVISNNNYKLTNQRKIVIDAIVKNQDQHLNCDEIYDLVKNIDSNLGLATIYRSLKLFVQLGILTELNIGDGSIRYDLVDLNANSHNHHHLICKTCGKIIEVKDDSLETVEKEIEKIYDFQIENHKCKFMGTCKECIENS